MSTWCGQAQVGSGGGGWPPAGLSLFLIVVTTRTPITPVAASIVPATGFVNAQAAAADFGAVKGFDGRQGVVVVHFNKAEAAGTPGFPIIDQVDRMNGSVSGEQVTNVI